MTSAFKITVYINEGDQWAHRPLYLQILEMLQRNGLAGATVLHAIAGFTQLKGVETTSLVDIDGKLPIVIDFIDTRDNIDKVLPELKKMVGDRLVIRQPVDILNYH
jgi:PII-like signaling protein